MKKFAFATLTALAAVVATQEQAKAWFNFGLGASFNTNISWGGLNVCRQAEPWPHTYGLPAFNNYGAACGVPSFPVNPYGMSTYGCPPMQGGIPGGVRPPTPFPGPQGQGSGPASFNYGSYYGNPYYGTGVPMPYAQQAALQQAAYYYPAMWYGR